MGAMSSNLGRRRAKGYRPAALQDKRRRRARAWKINTDVVHGNQSYGLDPSRSFVTAKREAIVFALGNLYSPAGVRMISVPVGSTSEWLVPENVIFSAECTNKEALPLLHPCVARCRNSF